MVNENIKETFERFVRNRAANPDSGTGSSYRKALDHLNEWLAHDRPTWAPEDVWAMTSPAAIMALYEHVLVEQEHFRNGGGVFIHAQGRGDSYIRKNWCSAALKAFAEFRARG